MRRAMDMLKQAKGLSERFACKVVGPHRATYRWLPTAQTPADPDADPRSYATKHPNHGFRARLDGTAVRRGV